MQILQNEDGNTQTIKGNLNGTGENVGNFKGIYYNNPTNKYFDPETGAHFEYSEMCKKLEAVLAKRLAEVPPTNSVELNETLPNPINHKEISLCGATLDPILLPNPPRFNINKNKPKIVNIHETIAKPPKIRLVAARLPTEVHMKNGPKVNYFTNLKRALTKDFRENKPNPLETTEPYRRAKTQHEIGDVVFPNLDLTGDLPVKNKKHSIKIQSQLYFSILTAF